MKRQAACCVAVLALSATGAVAETKQGGTLYLALRDTPPSASIHEETTNSTVVPFMPVFNNLMVFDQLSTRSDASTIKPDLADEWSWSEDGKTLTMRLHPGVKWHDGQPFTSADVQCTWDTLRGTRDAGWRKNPRKPWYDNLAEVKVNGDDEVSFVLKRPQPSFISYLASGFSPVYPCHVDGAQMRREPIGTGPFKVQSFSPNQGLVLERNSDYFKENKPHLDSIEYALIPNSGTRTLSFVSGQLDMTWSDINPEMEADIRNQKPDAICDLAPAPSTGQLVYNPKSEAFKDPRIRKAIALAIDRDAFSQVMSKGQVQVAGVMMPGPDGQWGLSPDDMADIPGYGKDIEANRAEARALMEELGYGPDKRLTVPLMTVNRPAHVTPSTLLADQLRDIYIDAHLDSVEISVWTKRANARSEYEFTHWAMAPAMDDPDPIFFENYACGAARNLSDYCNPDTQKMIEQQSSTTDPAERVRLVREIDRKLQSESARPVLYGSMIGECRQPYVKNAVRATNSFYNSFRYEDVWLDR